MTYHREHLEGPAWRYSVIIHDPSSHPVRGVEWTVEIRRVQKNDNSRRIRVERTVVSTKSQAEDLVRRFRRVVKDEIARDSGYRLRSDTEEATDARLMAYLVKCPGSTKDFVRFEAGLE